MELAVADSILPADLQPVLDRWLKLPHYADERDELEALLEQARAGDVSAINEIEDAFAQELPIGTGGRRGKCGPGPNRMNSVVIRETVYGLAMAMRQEGVSPSVVIAYDTRKDSRQFAHLAARQLAACGISVKVADDPRPTPELSFLVRELKCGAGIVISASHNPPADNGIKIYGDDGAQVIGERDRRLMTSIVEQGPSAPYVASGLLSAEELGSQIECIDLAHFDQLYHNYVLAQGVVEGSLLRQNLCVVYTPLHGVGHHAVLPVLRARAVTIFAVERQCSADNGRFSTVRTANPESPISMALAVSQAKLLQADIVIANDPDADRVGAMVRSAAGAYVFLNGNQLAALLLDHVVTFDKGRDNGWVLTTFVTTPLVGKIARAHNIDLVDDLHVGFKNHAAMMAEQPSRRLVLACEESHGYSRGNGVRDKDGAVAALLLTEAAALAKARGETLLDNLERIWKTYGYHREITQSIEAPGLRGREEIQGAMAAWRANPPQTLGDLALVGQVDYAKARSTGSKTRDLPGNVLSFEFASGSTTCKVVLRPSGTEPKIKLYLLISGEVAADQTVASVRAAVDALAQDLAAKAIAAVRLAMPQAAEIA